MGSTLFWGLLLVILGLSLIFRIVFNIDFPLLKIVIAFVLIFLGIRILFGSFGGFRFQHGENDTIFGEKRYYHTQGDRDFNLVFGKGTYDFRGYDTGGSRKKIKISDVFGACVIKLDKDLPVRIKVESAFAGVQLPNGNSAVFGSSTYESQNFDPDKPFMDLKIEVVFGGVEVHQY